MPEIEFPVEVVAGMPVVAAPEEIDITIAGSLRAALLAAAARGHGTFVVDMSRTRFCDSSGLHALVAAHKRAQAEGGEVLLVIPHAAVLRVFALTAMDRVIPNFASLPEALAQAPAARAGAMSGGPGEPGPPEGSRAATLAGTCRAVTLVRDDARPGTSGWSLAETGAERRDDAAISPVPPR